jgi:hypothetical protein
MTNPINDPFTYTASAMGEADEFLFEKMFNELAKNDLRKATPQEMAFALGVATGTILRLRKQVTELKNAQITTLGELVESGRHRDGN